MLSKDDDRLQHPDGAVEHGSTPAEEALEQMKANARGSNMLDLVEMIEHRQNQHGETKVDIPVPDVSHADHAVAQVLRMVDDPDLLSVRLTPPYIRDTTTPVADRPGMAPTLGALPVTHELVQRRLDQIAALVGGTRPLYGNVGTEIVETVTSSNIIPNTELVEQRNNNSVSLTLRRKKGPVHKESTSSRK